MTPELMRSSQLCRSSLRPSAWTCSRKLHHDLLLNGCKPVCLCWADLRINPRQTSLSLSFTLTPHPHGGASLCLFVWFHTSCSCGCEEAAPTATIISSRLLRGPSQSSARSVGSDSHSVSSYTPQKDALSLCGAAQMVGWIHAAPHCASSLRAGW